MVATPKYRRCRLKKPFEFERIGRRMDRHHRQGQRRYALERLARELMDRHGLNDWHLCDLKYCRERGPNNLETGGDLDAWGECLPLTDEDRALQPENMRDVKSTIFIAFDKASKKSLAWQRDLILHELAHALAPPGAGHGDVWATIAEQIGVRPMTVMYDLFVAKHYAYQRRQRRAGNQAKAAFEKRRSSFSEAELDTLARRLRRGD
jgi:hypothetical protein